MISFFLFIFLVIVDIHDVHTTSCLLDMWREPVLQVEDTGIQRWQKQLTMTSSFCLTLEMLSLMLQERLRPSPWGVHMRVTRHLLSSLHGLQLDEKLCM